MGGGEGGELTLLELLPMANDVNSSTKLSQEGDLIGGEGAGQGEELLTGVATRCARRSRRDSGDDDMAVWFAF